jgi:hypothetical protein
LIWCKQTTTIAKGIQTCEVKKAKCNIGWAKCSHWYKWNKCIPYTSCFLLEKTFNQVGGGFEYMFST